MDIFKAIKNLRIWSANDALGVTGSLSTVFVIPDYLKRMWIDELQWNEWIVLGGLCAAVIVFNLRRLAMPARRHKNSIIQESVERVTES